MKTTMQPSPAQKDKIQTLEKAYGVTASLLFSEPGGTVLGLPEGWISALFMIPTTAREGERVVQYGIAPDGRAHS